LENIARPVRQSGARLTESPVDPAYQDYHERLTRLEGPPLARRRPRIRIGSVPTITVAASLLIFGALLWVTLGFSTTQEHDQHQDEASNQGAPTQDDDQTKRGEELWAQAERMVVQKRFVEAHQILESLSKIQPRLEKAWDMMAFNAIYNIAGTLKDSEQRWKWIRRGFIALRRGIERNPENPFLKYALGQVLLHKCSWRGNGWFDKDLVRRIKADGQLQRKLRGLKKGASLDERLSPFLIAGKMMKTARDQLERQMPEKPVYKSQDGHLLYPHTLDSFVREILFLEGVYRWQEHDLDGARVMFHRAIRHTGGMIQRYGDQISPVNRDLLEFYKQLPPILDLYRGIFDLKVDPAKKRILRKQVLLELERTFVTLGGPMDGGYVLSLLSRLKRRLSRETQGEEDRHEFNDGHNFARPIQEGKEIRANLAPFLSDIDTYFILMLGPPRKEGARKQDPFIPRKITLLVSAEGDVTLRLRVLDPRGKKLTEAELKPRKRREISFRASKPGKYYVNVDAWKRSSELAPRSRYFLQWKSTDPPLPSDRR